MDAADPSSAVGAEVARRGAVQERQLRLLGLLTGADAKAPPGVQVLEGWWVHGPTYNAWQQRLRTAEGELEAQPEFPHVVVNDQLQQATEELARIVQEALAEDSGAPATLQDPNEGLNS